MSTLARRDDCQRGWFTGASHSVDLCLKEILSSRPSPCSPVFLLALKDAISCWSWKLSILPVPLRLTQPHHSPLSLLLLLLAPNYFSHLPLLLPWFIPQASVARINTAHFAFTCHLHAAYTVFLTERPVCSPSLQACPSSSPVTHPAPVHSTASLMAHCMLGAQHGDRTVNRSVYPHGETDSNSPPTIRWWQVQGTNCSMCLDGQGVRKGNATQAEKRMR